MVQQTLDATKTFIFDVRPMVLDDLGLVPTLKRAARERGRRARLPVEFDSRGRDRRLGMEIETTVFRLLDETLAAYAAESPERVTLRLDWSDAELEARLTAHRAAAVPEGDEPLPDVPTGKDVPDAIKQMIQDRHDAREAAKDAAQAASVVSLPAATRRDALERAASIGAIVEFLEGGSEVRLLVPISGAGEGGEAAADELRGGGPVTRVRDRAETTLVLGLLALLVAVALVTSPAVAGGLIAAPSGAAQDGGGRSTPGGPGRFRPMEAPRSSTYGEGAPTSLLENGLIREVQHMALIQLAAYLAPQDEEGQGLAEYALILALIAIVAIVALLFLGGAISGILNTVGTSV